MCCAVASRAWAARSGMASVVMSALVFGLLASMAQAQFLNVDFGDAPGTGDGDYVGVAASGQGGTWNYLNEPLVGSVETPLINADGTDTGVQLVFGIDTDVFDAEETGGGTLIDPDLMGDIHWLPSGGPTTIELRGVAPGTYSLFVYAYSGDVPADDTIFTYMGDAQTVANTVGPDPKSHGLGSTYALFFPVVPDANGVILFEMANGPGADPGGNFSAINGIQLSADPSAIPPSLVLNQPFRGTDDNGCCEYNWTLRNNNPSESLSEWCMEIEAGSGGRIAECTGIDCVTAEGGWTPSFCYPWDDGAGVSSPSSRAVICFSGGTPLLPGDQINGTLKIDVNGAEPVELPYAAPGNGTVIAEGIHVHVNQGAPDLSCPNGDYNSHTGSSDGWSGPIDVICLPAFTPIPAMSWTGQGVLLSLIALGGVVCVRGRRFPRAV
jgi:hypothetical protein